MHVGLYSPAWPPGELPNGVVTYVRVVRAELLRLGHRVSVFSGHCELDESERIYRVATAPRGLLWGALQRRMGLGWNSEYDFGPRIAQAVMRVHKRESLDVFEMEESFGWCSDVARQTRIPLVVKLHGPAFLSLVDVERETTRRDLRIEIEGSALRSARAIVAPSKSTRLDTARKYSLKHDAMLSIPNPIDPVANFLLWSARKEWSDEILFVGRFDKGKGGDAAIQAFAQLARSRPRLHLTFVGPDLGLALADGSLQHFSQYVQTHLEPGIASRIRFLGTRPAAEVQLLRVQCAVVMLATRRESFGYAVAEAMMQGCPIVGFDVAGVNELVVHGETGLLAPLDDVASLALLVARLLDDVNEAVALGARARTAIAATCGVQPVVGRMLELYERVSGQTQTAHETTW